MPKSSAGKPLYITTPIFYPNANPHLGHAYTTTIADIFARYGRLSGRDVYFLTGVDENSEKVVRAAKAAGVSTKEYLDQTVENFKSLYAKDKLNISYDQFIRTSDETVHWPGAEEVWKRLVKAGDIELRSYEGLYCVGHEAFITEKDLVNGKCPEHNEAPQRLKEENYFFKLSRYTKPIREKIESSELSIIPDTRRNEILALLERGLEDVSFSRPANKVSVGIPVPGDPTQKMYVWCDALSNYITALGFGRTNDSLYQKFWPNGDTLHVIGKDILRFHAAIWPGMLLSAGLPLPKKILVHGFLTSDGKKMSKTLGNVVDPNDLINEYGAEAVRYYLARHISPFEDGDITAEKFKDVYNANLANGIGNLVSRVMTLSERYVGNRVVELILEDVKNNKRNGFIDLAFSEFNVSLAVDMIWNHISKLDKKISDEEVFKVVKTDKDRAVKMFGQEPAIDPTKNVGYLWDLATIAYSLEAILPLTSENIINIMKSNKKPDKSLFPRK